jgi:hypothetical protein
MEISHRPREYEGWFLMEQKRAFTGSMVDPFTIRLSDGKPLLCLKRHCPRLQLYPVTRSTGRPNGWRPRSGAKSRNVNGKLFESTAVLLGSGVTR